VKLARENDNTACELNVPLASAPTRADEQKRRIVKPRLGAAVAKIYYQPAAERLNLKTQYA
jgi:hypothetical protein